MDDIIDMYSRYVYVCQSAKDGSFSSSDVIAICALIISVVVPFATIFFTRKHSVKETFWMREILIPQFTDILFTFVKESPARYLNESEPGQFYRSYALSVINSLRSSALVLGVVSKSLQKKIEDDIEEFEDDVMAVPRSEYADLVSDFARKLVESIQEAQFGV